MISLAPFARRSSRFEKSWGGWAGKHVIVTGGSMGIGAAMAQQLAAREANVSLIARGAPGLRAVAQKIGAEWVTADVSRSLEVSLAIQSLEVRKGPCDALFCCAGIVTPARSWDLTSAEVEGQMVTNYLGTVNSVRAVLDGMLERSRGRIVLVSSTAGLIGVFGYTGYGPTKAAVRQYALSLRYELDRTGVCVSVLYPPDTETPGFASEVLARPPETAAIAGSITPVSAESVAATAVRGVERGKPHIAVDPLTRFLVLWAGLPESLARPALRRTIERAGGQGRGMFGAGSTPEEI